MVRKVAVIMGSDSDWPVVKGACAQLKALDIPFEAHILSAHRTPAEAAAFAKGAKENGFGVILCAAGMAAHLAAEILALSDDALAAKLAAERAAMAEQIAAKEEKLQKEIEEL